MGNMITAANLDSSEVLTPEKTHRAIPENFSMSERLFKIFLENSYDVIFTLDADGRFVFASPSWERNFGYPVSEILGKSFVPLVHPDDVAPCMEFLQRTLSGVHSKISPPYRVKHADGSWRWFEASGMPYVGEDDVLMFTGAARDITERKHSELVMAARLRIMQNASSSTVAELLRSMLDEVEILTESQVSFYHFVEPDQTNLTMQVWSSNSSLLMCINEKSGGKYRINKSGLWADCIRNQRPVLHNEFTSDPRSKKMPHGHLTITRQMFIPVVRNGAVVALLGVGNKHVNYNESDIEVAAVLADLAWEISEKLQIEMALRESKARFDQLAEQSGTVNWELNSLGVFTYISKMTEVILGYSPEEVVGNMNFNDLLPESDPGASKESAVRFLDNQESFHNMELRLQAKDGRILWVATNSIPFLDSEGNLLGYRGSYTDITESKKLKEQLYQSQKMESVGQLAGGLAHDFNNVLSVINGYGMLLQMEANLDEQNNGLLEKILTASQRAGELTKSMLAFSRTQIMNPQHRNINDIISHIGIFIQRTIGDNIRFKTIVNETFLPVYVDDVQIEQILINLANNSRDAMPNGGEITISTNYRIMDSSFLSNHGFGEPGAYAVITVSDSGTGMDEDTQKKVFEPFFTTKEVGKGTGLGLAMVYGITKQHKGFVEVVSAPGQGASFSIYLPIVSLGPSSAPNDRTNTVEGILEGTETILIVDDDVQVRDFMSKLLVKYGYRTILATDGQDAVDKFKENHNSIQLVIMDMIMPHKSGKQAYDEIMKIKQQTRALFSSGYSANIIHQQGELGEFAEFIPKPVQPFILLKKIRALLDKQ